MRFHDVEAAHRRLIGVDGLILEYVLVDEFLARQVAVGVGDEVRVPGGDLGLLQVIDEFMGFGDVAGVARNGEIVEPQLRPLLRNRISDLDAVLGLCRALLRLLTSPEKPTAKQISPVASALRYSEEWNLRTDGLTATSRSAAFW